MIFQSYNPFDETKTIKDIWLTLLIKSPHSYFTTWEWVYTWISSLPKGTDVQLITGYLEKKPVIALFVGRTKRKRHGILPTKILSLNATANPYFDELTIEYNSILFDPTAPLDKDALFQYLKQLNWDEFTLPGVSQSFVSDFDLLEVSGRHFHLMMDKVTSSHFVELQKIRDSKMDYLKLLSANKRSQIRRSIKQYETDGKIQIHQAASTDEALLMLDKLASLHQQVWQERGEEGSFSNKYFFQFHRDLIQNRFSSNEIQILHVFNDKTTIGYLYNFIHNKKILFYQSGFNYPAGNNYRPGLVSHYFAIIYNAEQNMTTYDFLAGDSEYKTSLATDSTPMYWIRLIKSRHRYNIEMGIIKIKETAKALLRKIKIR